MCRISELTCHVLAWNTSILVFQYTHVHMAHAIYRVKLVTPTLCYTWYLRPSRGKDRRQPVTTVELSTYYRLSRVEFTVDNLHRLSGSTPAQKGHISHNLTSFILLGLRTFDPDECLI